MTQANLPSGQYLLIDVPEDQRYFDIYGNEHQQHLVYNSMPKPGKVRPIQTNLPSGQWELIGKGDAVTEDQAAGIVERYVYSGKSSYYAYKDYWGQKPQSEDDIFTTALSSFNSWIRSYQKEPSKIVVIKKV